MFLFMAYGAKSKKPSRGLSYMLSKRGKTWIYHKSCTILQWWQYIIQSFKSIGNDLFSKPYLESKAAGDHSLAQGLKGDATWVFIGARNTLSNIWSMLSFFVVVCGMLTTSSFFSYLIVKEDKTLESYGLNAGKCCWKQWRKLSAPASCFWRPRWTS